MDQSIEKKITRIKGHGKGWSFSQKDFTDLGQRTAIDTALQRLHDNGEIRRVTRGIYDYPKIRKLTQNH